VYCRDPACSAIRRAASVESSIRSPTRTSTRRIEREKPALADLNQPVPTEVVATGDPRARDRGLAPQAGRELGPKITAMQALVELGVDRDVDPAEEEAHERTTRSAYDIRARATVRITRSSAFFAGRWRPARHGRTPITSARRVAAIGTWRVNRPVIGELTADAPTSMKRPHVVWVHFSREPILAGPDISWGLPTPPELRARRGGSRQKTAY
jgi:hypothetical protein